MSRVLHILYVGGGTGGHIFPLYALHQWLTQSGLAGSRSRFVGLRGRIDSAIFVQLGVPHELENLPQPTGLRTRLVYLLRAVRSWLGWLGRIGSYDAVVTSGGYGALPAVLAARVRSVPLLGYEPNAVTGRTMRFLGPRAVASLARPFVNQAQPLIRTELYPMSSQAPTAATLLICGGSQGSLSLDRLMVAALRSSWPEGIERVVWLTGSAGYDEVRDVFGSDSRVELMAYSDAMVDLYRRCRVAVARAGASSIFELAAWGIPTVYVPLPWSADDHQVANARSAAALGWGFVVEEREGVAALGQALGQALAWVVPPAGRPQPDRARQYWTQRICALAGGQACA